MLALRRAGALVLFVSLACNGSSTDDDGADSSPGSTGSSSGSTSGPADGGPGDSMGTADDAPDDGDGSETAMPDTGDDDNDSTTSTSDTVDDDGSSESTGEPVVCEDYATGEWANCIDNMGKVDNTVCNWVPGRTNGTASCFTAPGDAGAVCNIVGCVDACDCFAPPETGSAEVVCADFGGADKACGLACDEDHICPDGMNCVSGLCFHP